MADSKNKALPVGTVLRGAVYTYTVEKVLGQGSFGITYLASTLIKGPLGELPMPVAVKEFFAKDLDSRGEGGTVSARTEDGVAYRYAKAFQRESQNLSKMKHPGIVKVLEAFQTNGTYYYSMEYLPGGSLDDKVKGEGIPEAEALPMIKKIGEALAFMHGRKMMHLDLKPKNIMLKADGMPVIIDFGLSKQYDERGEPESSSTIGLGTPGYAPLEQANRNSGKLFQSTLDIYALGATLYKMLTGVTPPDASSILDDGLPEIELKSKGVSDTTISAIRNAMSPGRKNRTPSVEDFLSMLAGKSVGPEDKTEDETEPKPAPKPTQKPSPAPGPAPTPPGRKPKTWLWALLGGLAVLAVAAPFIFGGKNHNQGAGGNSGADTLAVVPVDSAVETPVAPPVNDPVPEAPGSIEITSKPAGAAIWLDGKYTKKHTPEILEGVTPGKHTYKLLRDGYKSDSGSITVTSGQRAYVVRTLKAVLNPVPKPKKRESFGSPAFTGSGAASSASSASVTTGRIHGNASAHLSGRSVVGTLPLPSYHAQIEGTVVVVVQVKVDQYGNVQEAVPGVEGTTVTDSKLWNAARYAAMEAHFNTKADAPVVQVGTITYIF